MQSLGNLFKDAKCANCGGILDISSLHCSNCGSIKTVDLDSVIAAIEKIVPGNKFPSGWDRRLIAVLVSAVMLKAAKRNVPVIVTFSKNILSIMTPADLEHLQDDWEEAGRITRSGNKYSITSSEEESPPSFEEEPDVISWTNVLRNETARMYKIRSETTYRGHRQMKRYIIPLFYPGEEALLESGPIQCWAESVVTFPFRWEEFDKRAREEIAKVNARNH